MAVYDENIAKNPFFVALEKLRPDLCDRVARLHGIVLVPCCGSLEGSVVSQLHFDSYVVQPVEDGYQTADGKEVRILDRQVLLGSGSLPPPVSVAILFEETFYNAREESYSILCISRPVDAAEPPDPGPEAAARTLGAGRHLRSLEEVKEFLGRHGHKLDKLIGNFCHAFKEHDRKGLRHHIDSVQGLYTRCLQCVLRDACLKALAKRELQMSLLKQAVEVYVHHGIHSLIFNLVGTLEASQDAAFNKITRSLHELQHKDVGVKAHLSINLSAAKRELSQLNQHTSPLLKLLCLRKVALTATRTPSRAVSMEAVCADDLLSVILYLLVKVEIPNWMANLSYMRNFCFSQSSKDELSYCLSTFEAAAEYIKLGKLQHVLAGCVDTNGVLRMNVELASASTPISRLFEHVANGNAAEVERLLSEGESEEEARPCHPLCACDLCDLQLSGKLNDPSVVTASSRDERGYTPLHVAAICGQAQLIDLLASKGAPVNAADYHALTPLHLACQKGHQGVTLLLLHYKADADAQDNNGNTPLHLACTYGHEDCVKALVYYDFQTCCLDLHNDKGDTPLHLASRWGYEAIIRVLLENGAGVRALNNSAHTPAHCALNSKVLTLLQEEEEQRRRNGGGGGGGGSQSPAWVCPQASERSARRSSTSSGTSSSPDRELPPESAPARHRQVEKLLRAVADGDVQMVRYLLEWTDEDEADALAEASLCHPLCQCATCAPAHKARAVPCGALSAESANADGVTPLHVACTYGRAELTSLLVRHGAEVDARTDRKATPLHLASQNNHPQVVKFLLECNAKLNKKDRYGNTALIHACLHGNLDTAATLIQSEALVNVRNRQGNTALHCAVRAGHQGLVDILLKAGASPHLRNKKHRTPLDAAYQQGGKNTEIVRSLQKASGLSPDEEPIKLLSVPKGALAHSFVQRLRHNDAARHKSAASRIQQTKKTSCSPTGRSAAPEQASPNGRRQRLRRGGTVDAVGPTASSDGSPRSRGRRGLARWHTLDSGEEAPQPPIEVRAWTGRRHDDDDAPPAFVMTSSFSNGRTPNAAAAATERSDDDACDVISVSIASSVRHANARDAPRLQDAPISSDVSAIKDTLLSGDTSLIKDAPRTLATPNSSDAPRIQDTPVSSDGPDIKDTRLVRDESLSSENLDCGETPHAQDTPILGVTSNIKDTPLSCDVPLIKGAPRTFATPNSSDAPLIQDTPVSSYGPDIKDIRLARDESLSSENLDCSETPHVQDTPILGVTSNINDTPLSGDTSFIKDALPTRDTPILGVTSNIKDTPLSCDVPLIKDAPLIQDTPVSSDGPDIKDIRLVRDESLSSENLDCSETPHVQDMPILGVTSNIKDMHLSGDTSFIKDALPTRDTPILGVTSNIKDMPLSCAVPLIKDTRLVRDESLSSENLDCSETPHVQDTPILGVTSNIKDTPPSCDVPLIKDGPRTLATPNSSDAPRIQDTPVSSDGPDIKDTRLDRDESLSSENLDSGETPHVQDTHILGVTSNIKDTSDSAGV